MANSPNEINEVPQEREKKWATFRSQLNFSNSLPIAVGVLASLLAVAPMLARKGWPLNHDGLAFVFRMVVTARRFALGELIPVWSSVLQGGFGSPLPGLYHKAFSYVSAFAYLISQNSKTGIVTAFVIFTTLAVWGVAKALRWTSPDSNIALPSAVAGILLVFSSYATTDWLIRGAFAEYAAIAAICLMMIPTLKLISTGRCSFWFTPSITLVFLSHSGIALFTIPLLAISFAMALYWHPQSRGEILKRGLLNAIFTAIVCLPFVAPILAFRGSTDDSGFLNPGMQPAENFRSVSSYLWDESWSWGDWRDLPTVQFDLYTLPLLAIACGIAFRNWRENLFDQWRRCLMFLLIAFTVYFALQMSFSLWIYEFVPGLRYIQFPWRLQSFNIVFVSLIAGIVLIYAREHMPRSTWIVGGLLMIASTIFNLPIISGIRYEWLPEMQVFKDDRVDYLAGGEFGPDPPDGRSFKQWEYLAQSMAMPLAGECTIINRLPMATVETRQVKFDIDCRRAGVAQFPIFMMPGVKVNTANGSSEPLRSCDDPRLRVNVPQGKSTVVVDLPSWIGVVSSLRTEKRADRCEKTEIPRSM